MTETFLCQLCGFPAEEKIEEEEVCLLCIRAINSKKKVPIGTVKWDEYHRLGIESYFLPKLKGGIKRQHLERGISIGVIEPRISE